MDSLIYPPTRQVRMESVLSLMMWLLLQVAIAQLLTVIYALVQMLVLVGIILQIADEGPCSPTSIFFFYVAGTFIVAALLHPQVCCDYIYGLSSVNLLHFHN